MKKALSILASLIISISVIPPTAVNAEEDVNYKFEKFMDDTYYKSIIESPINQYLSGEEGLDNESSPSLISDNSEEDDKVISQLKSFDYSKLNDSNKHSYDAILFTAEKEKEISKYPDLQFLFTPTTGIQNNLITTCLEDELDSERDVTKHITMLNNIPKTLSDAVKITKSQAENGYCLTDRSLNQTAQYIDSFADKKDDNALITDFNSKIDSVSYLTEKEKEDYKKQVKDVVINKVIPSFKDTSTALLKLHGTRNKNQNKTKESKVYYTALTQYEASTNESPKQLLEDCRQFLNYEVYKGNVVATTPTTKHFQYSDSKDALKQLSNNLNDYPNAGKIPYTVSYLDSSVADSNIYAYYVKNKGDDFSNNIIKVNKKNTNNKNNLYITLAHEGFPGHAYQANYYHSLNPNHLREYMQFNGYLEGWAEYASVQTIEESDLNTATKNYLRSNVVVAPVLQAAVDIARNCLGYSKKQVEDFCTDVGYPYTSAINAIIDAVDDTPTALIPYGIGLMKFIEFRDAAQLKLGKDFNVVEYHKVVLNNGPRTLDSVQSDINTWLEKQGKSKMHLDGMYDFSATRFQTLFVFEFFVTIGLLICLFIQLIKLFKFVSKKLDSLNDVFREKVLGIKKEGK